MSEKFRKSLITRQLRVWLIKNGFSEDQADAAIATIEEELRFFRPKNRRGIAALFQNE